MSSPIRHPHSISNNVSIKFITIALIGLALLIPAGLIQNLIDERNQRQDEAVNDIASKWGAQQCILGPVVEIPLIRNLRSKEGSVYSQKTALTVLPESLEIVASLDPQIRYRGIYEAVLYSSETTLKGTFQIPSDSDIDLHQQLFLDQAIIHLGITDLSGIQKSVEATIAGTKQTLEPGTLQNIKGTGVQFKLAHLELNQSFTFEIKLTLNGNQRIDFAPVGKSTSVQLSAPWSTPSFDGNFLPTVREVSEDGFTAKWNVLYYNRDFPQHWIGPEQSPANARFGVNLLVPANVYQQATRTTKYAHLFILFTFVGFFLTEIIRRERVHPVQYLLIGASLILFYTLLISLSEHSSFGIAYLIAAASTIALISFYSANILGKTSLGIFTSIALTVLYAYAYMLLQLEDFSLLLGSIALFLLLALFMFLTRKIDWYSISKSTDPDSNHQD